MKKLTPILLAASLAFLTPMVGADTIHLKNGSVLKGKVASFADEQFIVMLDTGSGRYMSRAMIFIGDVARIEFDSAPADATQSRAVPSASQPGDGFQRNVSADPPARSSQPADTPRETTASETQPSAQPAREPESREPDSSASSPAPTNPTVTEAPETERAPRKLAGPVKTANIDVIAKRDWTSTGIIIKRGDRIRITANGTITLDPVSGQMSGPEGSDLSDTRKLMQDRPTGALIGVIGADNDDFIFIGRAAEFTAARDGLLFLSVNEGALSDNAGAYKAVIEVQQAVRTSRQ